MDTFSYLTLYPIHNYRRPYLVTKALGGLVSVKYIGSAPGSSCFKFDLARKTVRALKIYYSVSIRKNSKIIFLNPYPLAKIINYSIARNTPFVIDFMDVLLNEDLELDSEQIKILERAKGVIFWSKAFARLVNKQIDISQKQAYIPSGVDVSLIKSIQDLSNIPQELPLEKTITYFGYKWLIDGKEVQGIYDLISAMPIVKNHYKNIRLVISGVSPDKNLVNHIKKVGAGMITFADSVPYGSQEFLSRLINADMLVLPTTSHPSVFYAEQHKLFMYMATRKPIIATDTPGTRGVLDDKTAYFANADNPQSIAMAIIDALNNPSAAKEKANAAYRLLLEKYTWDILAPKYREFVMNCL